MLHSNYGCINDMYNYAAMQLYQTTVLDLKNKGNNQLGCNSPLSSGKFPVPKQTNVVPFQLVRILSKWAFVHQVCR